MRPSLRARAIFWSVLLAAPIALGTLRGVLRAGDGDVIADRVLGQIDFAKTAVNFVDSTGLNAPAAVAIDKLSGHVIVADTQNNRVLGWKSESAFINGGAADLVIGQADFNSSGCNRYATPDASRLCGPVGVAVDGAHRVYVGDTRNNRVVVFDDPFAALPPRRPLPHPRGPPHVPVALSKSPTRGRSPVRLLPLRRTDWIPVANSNY